MPIETFSGDTPSKFSEKTPDQHAKKENPQIVRLETNSDLHAREQQRETERKDAQEDEKKANNILQQIEKDKKPITKLTVEEASGTDR